MRRVWVAIACHEWRGTNASAEFQVSGSSYRLELWHGVGDGLLRVFSINRSGLERSLKIAIRKSPLDSQEISSG
jgi:hypothetical protein